MVISLTTCDVKGAMHQYTFPFDHLEVGLEMINIIVNEDEKILEVRLSDKTGTMLLPVEAFDGISCLAPIKKLQKEWQKLIKKTRKSVAKTVSKSNQKRRILTKKRLINGHKGE